MVVPVLRGIARLLRRMFSSEQSRAARKKEQKEKNGTTARPSGGTPGGTEESRRRFREALAEMQKEYLSPDETAEQRLHRLKEAWNPLIDPVAQENLLQDVNSLCRDALRKMRSSRTLQPPDHNRIRELAHRIGTNKACDRIRRRQEFETYLELYMITYLQRSEKTGR